MNPEYTIGVLIGNANSPHTHDLMEGISRSARESNINVLFFLGVHSSYYYVAYYGEDMDDDYDYQFYTVFDYSRLARLDALIVSYGTLGIYLEKNDKYSFLNRFANIPKIFLEETDETGKISSIISDNYQGMHQVVEHLVTGHGYRNFTFLAGPPGNTDAEQRKQAFLDVIRKYGLPFDESCIAYGDFSECVDTQVKALLDAHPEMDAMVCANDIMAGTVYKECEKRGLVIGSDLAVTGYDDVSSSISMDPPLTTVLQNAFHMGREALRCAVRQIKRRRAENIVIPAKVRYRCSCGCQEFNNIRFDLAASGTSSGQEDILDRAAGKITENILLTESEESVIRYVRQQIREILAIDFARRENHQLILDKLSAMIDHEIFQYFSPRLLSKNLTSYIAELLENLTREPGYAKKSILALNKLGSEIQSTVASHLLIETSKSASRFKQETWFLPMIAKDMLSQLPDPKAFYASTLEKLAALGLSRSYLFLLEEPVMHTRGNEWSCPGGMYLACFHEGSHVTSYAPGEMPLITAGNGLTSVIPEDSRYSMSILSLFSGEFQYGILMTEIQPDNLALTYLLATQIGNTLMSHQMFIQQQQTHRELEKLVQEINEKNSILNYMSEYDTLTDCHNRHGFVEKMNRILERNEGHDALFVMADMDHLKQINDVHGHTEGDFAIRYCASRIKEALGEMGIVGRIGGDEFVAMILSDDPADEQKIRRSLGEACDNYNSISGKPYYIEISMGFHRFTCHKGLSFSDIMKPADEEMYEDKKLRRTSVLR